MGQRDTFSFAAHSGHMGRLGKDSDNSTEICPHYKIDSCHCLSASGHQEQKSTVTESHYEPVFRKTETSCHKSCDNSVLGLKARCE